MLEVIPGLKAVPLPMSGGIDEESPADGLKPEDALKMTNWRLSKNGVRIQKRAGLQQEDTAFGEDVYGYTTYYDVTPAFCKIAVLESEIQRKVGAGAWTNIYDFSSNIDHPVKVLEIQDKQFIITEKGGRVIQSDGGVRQIGISPPTTLPTATPGFAAGITPPMNDAMNYADQAAMDAVWADGDSGAGSASTQDGTDPDGVPGPDADAKYMKLVCTGASTTAFAQRTQTLASPIGKTYALQVNFYFDTAIPVIGLGIGGLHITIDNGDRIHHFNIAMDGVFFETTNGDRTAMVDMSTLQIIPWNKWIVVNITAEKRADTIGYDFHAFVTFDSVIKASGQSYDFSEPSTSNGLIKIQQYGNATTFIDHIRLDTPESLSSTLVGRYRYAVSFARLGDYGCESNALKSLTGTPVFTGTGTNDMTMDAESEYTGDMDRSIRVQVSAEGSPDTVKWSEDGGTTWKASVPMAAKVYLPYGLLVDFATLDTHTAGDYWTIPCTSCSALAANQQIVLASIPTSSDQQVTARKIYRTTSGGAVFFYLTTLYDRATTTTFTDNIPDFALGEELVEDRDLYTEASTTIGGLAEWWDNRLWIADHTQNLIYYSAIRDGGPVPEEFSITDRFIPVMRGVQDDAITALKSYKDALYVFKRNDIFIIQKTSLGYAPYHLNSDLGCVAFNCIEEVNDFLTFPSERGFEIYDGVRSFGPDFSVAVSKTYKTIDAAGYKYMTIAHDKEFNEVWLSIPTRKSGAAAITVVWNYIRNKFYFFQFYKVPSWIGRCKDSTGENVLKMGTRDGFVLLCDYGTADHTTAITATYRKGWLDLQAHGIAHLLQTSFELPATKTLTVNVYVDMQIAALRTMALTGITPAATDIDIRRIIGDKTEIGATPRWISVEYTNAEDCGGDCKVNEAALYARPELVKNKTYGN